MPDSTLNPSLPDLLTRIESGGYCHFDNVSHIRTDIILPANFPFECPVDRGAEMNPEHYLEEKAKWVAEALRRTVAFIVDNTPENLAVLRIPSSALGKGPNGVYLPDFDIRGYENERKLMVTLSVCDWLRLGGKNLYHKGEFLEGGEDFKLPANCLPVQFQDVPDFEGWEEIDILDVEKTEQYP